MIDLEAFGNGFGLVVISLLLGIIIRAIVSALRIGSSRFNSVGVLFLFNIAFQHSVICSRHQNRPGGSLPGGPGYRLLCC